MVTLVIRNLPDQLYVKLKVRARKARRSVSQEVVSMIEAGVLPGAPTEPPAITRLSGALPFSSEALNAALADQRYRHYASLSDLNQYMDELRADHPESQRLQDFKRNVKRVVAAFRSLKPNANDNEITYLLKNYPLSDFGQKTPFELIEAGRTDDVVAYLESFRAGFVG